MAISYWWMEKSGRIYSLPRAPPESDADISVVAAWRFIRPLWKEGRIDVFVWIGDEIGFAESKHSQLVRPGWPRSGPVWWRIDV